MNVACLGLLATLTTGWILAATVWPDSLHRAMWTSRDARVQSFDTHRFRCCEQEGVTQCVAAPINAPTCDALLANGTAGICDGGRRCCYNDECEHTITMVCVYTDPRGEWHFYSCTRTQAVPCSPCEIKNDHERYFISCSECLRATLVLDVVDVGTSIRHLECLRPEPETCTAHVLGQWENAHGMLHGFVDAELTDSAEIADSWVHELPPRRGDAPRGVRAVIATCTTLLMVCIFVWGVLCFCHDDFHRSDHHGCEPFLIVACCPCESMRNGYNNACARRRRLRRLRARQAAITRSR